MPSKTWKVTTYEEKDGTKPVDEYIFSGHSQKDSLVIMNVLVSLQNLGPHIQGTDMDKLIDGPIRELRKDRHRILYGRHQDTFVLLTAFLKKSQKTPPEQIALAKKRFEAYLKEHKSR